jgi:hypothetical protein
VDRATIEQATAIEKIELASIQNRETVGFSLYRGDAALQVYGISCSAP